MVNLKEMYMLVKKDTSRINGISDKSSYAKLNIDEIKNYIKKTVDDFCKNNPCEWFCVRNLFGSDWRDTPLQDLYEYRKSILSPNPVDSAGIDAGNLLKRVLADDNNYYEVTFCKNTHMYRKIN